MKCALFCPAPTAEEIKSKCAEMQIEFWTNSDVTAVEKDVDYISRAVTPEPGASTPAEIRKPGWEGWSGPGRNVIQGVELNPHIIKQIN